MKNTIMGLMIEIMSYVMIVIVLSLMAKWIEEVSCSEYVDVTTNERYVTLLNTENYITPSGAHVSDPSQFYGIFYVAVQDNGTTLQITGVHQVGFATLVTLNGPASIGQYSPNVIATLASGPAAQSFNLPVQSTFAATPQVVSYLREGKLYVQVSADGKTSGQIRGNVIPNDANLVNFISTETSGYKADLGMALLNANTLNTQPANLGLLYFVLSTFQSGQWTAFNLVGQQVTPFGTITPGLNVTAVATPYSSPPVRISVTRADLYACPLNSTAYSPLVLGLIQPLLPLQFQPFILTTLPPKPA